MTFEVGARVRCIHAVDWNDLVEGAIGTVRHITRDAITVEFDDNVDGHSGLGYIEYGFAWDCQPEDLELLDAPKATRSPGSIGEFFKKLEAEHAL